MTGIIILAAGASTRMGQPKQQLKFENETLLHRAINAALNADVTCLVLVLGANAAAIEQQITNSGVTIIKNNDWQSGMASSIRTGLHRLLELHPAVQHALLMLCDQPFVTSALLHQLIQTQRESNADIVACAYQHTTGAPVLFSRKYFNELLALTGQEGAKKLLKKFSREVISIPFENGGVDIDTPEDYQRLINPF